VKVLFLTHYFPPEGNAPAVRTHENCRRWAKWGHEVTVITGVPNVPSGVVYEGYRNRWRQQESIDGIRVVRVWTYIAANRGFLRRILNYLSFMFTSLWAGLFSGKADVIVATSPQFFCGVGGYLLSRLRRLPFVLEVRDLWPESIVAVGAVRNRAVIRILEYVEKFLYRHSDRIVVVTDSFKEIICGHGVDPARIAVFKNGVDLDHFPMLEKENEFRKQLGEDVTFVVSYIGTVGMAHGVGILLEAADKLRDRPEILFLIVGDGAEREELERRASAMSLSNVRFVGRVPRDRVPERIAASDLCLVLLRPSALFRTVLPSKMFEFMAMARPVVMAVEGEAAELLERSGGGRVVEPGNADRLVETILELMADPARCDQMGRSGREFVSANFRRDDLSRAYLDFLEEAAGDRPTAGRPE